MTTPPTIPPTARPHPAQAAPAERRQRPRDRRKATANPAAAEARGYEALGDHQWHQVLTLAVQENRRTPAIEAEIARRAGEHRLAARDMHLLLCVAEPTWQGAQIIARNAMAAAPHTALSVLALQYPTGAEWDVAAAGRTPAAGFRAQVSVPINDGDGRGGVGGDVVRSAVRRGPSKKAARQQAALSLLCWLADLPDVSGDGEVPPAATPPPPGDPAAISAVNQHVQAGRLADLAWAYTSCGPTYAPLFTCTARARADSRPLKGTGVGASKAAAKATAAELLLSALGEASK